VLQIQLWYILLRCRNLFSLVDVKTIDYFLSEVVQLDLMIQSDACSSYHKPLVEKYLHQYQVFIPGDNEIFRLVTYYHCKFRVFVVGIFRG